MRKRDIIREEKMFDTGHLNHILKEIQRPHDRCIERSREKCDCINDFVEECMKVIQGLCEVSLEPKEIIDRCCPYCGHKKFSLWGGNNLFVVDVENR